MNFTGKSPKDKSRSVGTGFSVTLKELVKGKKVRFKFYRDGELWYENEDGFDFPVPINDTGTGMFKAEDGAIHFMRWIRKHLEARAEWNNEREAQARNLTPSQGG